MCDPFVRSLMKQEGSFKIIADNRRAGFEYHLLDRFEAGLVLSGTEVKACKSGKVNLQDAYGEVLDNEAWLQNAHISEYSHGNQFNHQPVHKRKLLLHRKEIDKLHVQTREKGLTIVPTKIYLKNGRIKVEVAIGRGKKLHDKRAAERERELDNEAKAAINRKR
jgi:SsrA-binding protein